jgi:hypothetical protein
MDKIKHDIESRKIMKETIISSIVSMVVGTVIGWILSRFQTAADRRRAFRACVRDTITSLDSIKFDLNVWRNGDLFKWHQSTILTIRTNGTNILEDVCHSKRSTLNTALTEYCSLTLGEVEPHDLMRYDEARKNLKTILERMVGYAK